MKRRGIVTRGNSRQKGGGRKKIPPATIILAACCKFTTVAGRAVNECYSIPLAIWIFRNVNLLSNGGTPAGRQQKNGREEIVPAGNEKCTSELEHSGTELPRFRVPRSNRDGYLNYAKINPPK